MMSGAVGSGVPNAYPLAINSPLDRAYLRPLQEPLYDTEMIDYSTPPTALTFFQRPISQATASLNVTKTEAETNINQSSMLDYPREFSILGFCISIDSTIGLKYIGSIYRRAFFQFTFSGRRPYLQIPLDRIPAGQGLEGAVSSEIAASTTELGVVSCFKNGLGHIANYYKFNLGRSALKIKPGEAFNGRIGFPQTLPVDGAGIVGLSTRNNFFGETATNPLGWFVHLYLVGGRRQAHQWNSDSKATARAA